jgi:hypothetical protein
MWYNSLWKRKNIKFAEKHDTRNKFYIHAIKAYRRIELHLYSFLISALRESLWPKSRSGPLYPGERTSVLTE